LSLAASGAQAQSTLNGLSFPASETGTGSAAATLFVNSAVPVETVVNLSSNNPALTVPASITVPAGASAVGFTFNYTAVSTGTNVIVGATDTLNGSYTQTGITLNASVVTTTPGLTAASAGLGFGNVTVGSTASGTVVLTDTGTANTVISGATVSGAGFTIPAQQLPVTLTPGASLTIQVSFAPSAAQAFSGALSVTSNAPAVSVPLSGTGVAAPANNPTLNGLSFPASETGAGSATGTLWVNANVPVATVVNLSSNNPALTVPASVTVPQGQSSVAIPFNYTAVSANTYVIVGATDTLNGSQNQTGITLNASGPPPAAHQVTLSWQAGTPTGNQTATVAYNVYRDGARINTSGAVTATSYVDTTVSAGQTYSYYVTALDASNHEGTLSNTTSATVPTP
jgi:hypothetical protein